ncbi:MAG: phospholipid/cholesterol/gamma-HCH transport system substrate-binding protein [Halieaceae bacterium]|jgi:phospholipid/cholesterol/gamma-HCH transport system substrate-binding protein
MAEITNVFQTSVRDKLMGAVVLAGMLVLIYLSIYGAQFQGVGFTPDYYYTRLRESYGISGGSEISLSGVRIGSVESLVLEKDGGVLVTLHIEPKYESFIREGSVVAVDSKLALGNVISGQGLQFVPGEESAPLLPKGAMFGAEEPQSIEELMDEWNIRELAMTVQKMAREMSEVVSSINDNQSELINTLTHTASITENMAEATAQIPQMVGDISQLLQKVNSTIDQVGGDASRLTSDLSGVMQNTADLTATLSELTKSLAPTAEKSPILMDNLIQVSRETEVLMGKLNQHWLLGGSETPKMPEQRLDLPADDGLYSTSAIRKPK